MKYGAELKELRDAKKALAEVSEEDKKKGERSETERYLEANKRVADAEAALPPLLRFLGS